MNTFEALSAARDAIVKGWVQGSYDISPYSEYQPTGHSDPPNGNERFCSIGSIQHALSVCTGIGASSTNTESGGLFAKVSDYLTHAMAQLGFVAKPAKSLSGKYNQIIAFNDAKERTKDEVLAAFNKAVSNAKRRHLNG